LTLFAFTPTKFTLLLLTSVGVTLATANRPATTHNANQATAFGLYPAAQAIGQDNGTLSSNFYLANGYMPAMHGSERHGSLTPLAIRHADLPIAR